MGLGAGALCTPPASGGPHSSGKKKLGLQGLGLGVCCCFCFFQTSDMRLGVLSHRGAASYAGVLICALRPLLPFSALLRALIP